MSVYSVEYSVFLQDFVFFV